MAKPIFGSGFNLKPSSVIRVVVDISPDARRFTIDLGIGGPDIALHFNPRFNYLRSHNVIVFNTFQNGNFGEELRESHFPFQKGNKAEIFIMFDSNFFLVRLPDGFEYNFPNRTKATVINYVGIHGDVTIRTLAFE
ncbi:galectin-1-like [Petaurus breviceps papuanus]|uniref:galectin-1-like n=1 Tax=Petaurus breviceps papuanus TaxID=3040969 RepID=UPI0036DE8596